MACAIIAAAGSGERLGARVFKLDYEILGEPLVIHALRPFESCSLIDKILIVVPPSRLSFWTIDKLKSFGIGKEIMVVAGGRTRQDSVRLALEHVEGDGVVIIHDGARPCVTVELIERVIDIPEGTSGVVLGIPPVDTIKEVRTGRVVRTIDRDALIQVQTPQAFPASVLKKAHMLAKEHEFEATDDAALIERMGGLVVVREGSRENIKVTYWQDAQLAESILKGRKT